MADYLEDDWWNVGGPPTEQAPYTGPVPQGFTQGDVENFLARNPGDEHRVSEALVPSSQGGQSAPMPTSGAPKSIQPFGQTFGFDASKLGQTEDFKFRYDKAMQAIERSGAAKGTLLNPQTWKAMQAEASGLAAQYTNDEFARQAGTYDRNFDTHAWNESSRFNSQRTNRVDDWGFANADRQFNRGVFESDRGFGYGQQRDNINDQWRFIDYGYGAQGNRQ
jgi:hypothetical protein